MRQRCQLGDRQQVSVPPPPGGQRRAGPRQATSDQAVAPVEEREGSHETLRLRAQPPTDGATAVGAGHAVADDHLEADRRGLLGGCPDVCAPSRVAGEVVRARRAFGQPEVDEAHQSAHRPPGAHRGRGLPAPPVAAGGSGAAEHLDDGRVFGAEASQGAEQHPVWVGGMLDADREPLRLDQTQLAGGRCPAGSGADAEAIWVLVPGQAACTAAATRAAGTPAGTQIPMLSLPPARTVRRQRVACRSANPTRCAAARRAGRSTAPQSQRGRPRAPARR